MANLMIIAQARSSQYFREATDNGSKTDAAVLLRLELFLPPTIPSYSLGQSGAAPIGSWRVT